VSAEQTDFVFDRQGDTAPSVSLSGDGYSLHQILVWCRRQQPFIKQTSQLSHWHFHCTLTVDARIDFSIEFPG